MQWCLFAVVSLAFAADSTQRPKRIREIAESVMVAPPELAADVLLHLAEGGKVVDPKWKRELVETAWNLGRSAAFSAPLLNAVDTSTDTDIGFLVAALGTGLSTAGIQARAIAFTETLDRQRAREMFFEMARPRYVPLDCSAAGYTSHAPYFAAVDVVAGGFTPQEQAEGKRTSFLSDAIRSAATPRDFQLSLELLKRQSWMSNQDLVDVVAVWAANLERASFDDRTYETALPFIWSETFFNLARHLHERDLATTPAILAFRDYFTRHETAARCGEATTWKNNAEKTRQAFNMLLMALAPDVPMIKPEEITPASLGANAKIADYLQTDDQIKQIRTNYAHLRFGSKEQQATNKLTKRPDGMASYLTEEQRGTPEWNREAFHFMDQLESWSGNHGQPTKDLFHQKCTWYTAFIYILPEGVLRERVLQSYVAFVSGSPVKRESPPEWVFWVNRLIKSSEVKDRSHWLNLIEAAGDATVSSYVRLNRLMLGTESL